MYLLQVAAVERVIDTITLSSAHDRTSAKHLDLLMQLCTTPSLHAAHAKRRLGRPPHIFIHSFPPRDRKVTIRMYLSYTAVFAALLHSLTWHRA